MKFFLFIAASIIALLTTSATADPVDGIIKLSNGDQIHGSITHQNDKIVTIEHSSLGTLEIKRDQIATILTIRNEPMPAELLPQEPADNGLFGSGFLADWKRDFEFGLNGAKGVSENLNIRAAFVSTYKDEEDRWNYEMLYLNSQSDNITSQSRAQVILNKDWLIPESKWFYFANGRFDWDEFKDWNYRISAFVGPGYEFIDTDEWYLRGRAGIGGNQTFGDTERFTLEALAGLETGWHITDQQFIEFKTTFYPGLSNLGEYRNITTLDWIHDLDYYRGLAVKLGIYNEYDSQQRQGNDFRYFATIVWGL